MLLRSSDATKAFKDFFSRKQTIARQVCNLTQTAIVVGPQRAWRLNSGKWKEGVL